MRDYLSYTFLFFLLFSMGCAQAPKLIWEENFDGTTLNEEVWNFELCDGSPNLCGWGNNEKQIYTKSNHIVKDGLLSSQIKKKMAFTPRLGSRLKQKKSLNMVE